MTSFVDHNGHKNAFHAKADQKCLCYAFEVVWIKSTITNSCFKVR